MTIQLNETVSVEFDQHTIALACEELARIREKRNEQVVDALFVVLAFRHLEKAKPGTLTKINEAIREAARK
jgi:hypothetical protein